MIDSRKEAVFLGLSDKDQSVLRCLSEKKTETVTGIAGVIGMPRTTVEFLLRGLNERGFVERVRVKGHKEWRRVKIEKLTQRVRDVLRGLEKVGKIAGSIESRDIGIEVYMGLSNIKKVYERMLTLSRGGRVYVLQGNRSVELQLKKIDKQYLFGFHQRIKKRRIVIEGIIGESALQLFDKMENDELESHAGRLVVAYVVPDDFVDFDIDVILLREVVLLVDMVSEHVVVIRNQSIVGVLHSMFEAVQEQARSVNLNEYIQKLLQKREE